MMANEAVVASMLSPAKHELASGAATAAGKSGDIHSEELRVLGVQRVMDIVDRDAGRRFLFGGVSNAAIRHAAGDR